MGICEWVLIVLAVLIGLPLILLTILKIAGVGND